MVESSIGKALVFLVILGDGAACADDDLINEVVGGQSSEEGCSSVSTSGRDNDVNLYNNNSSSVLPLLPFCSGFGAPKYSSPLLLGEDQKFLKIDLGDAGLTDRVAGEARPDETVESLKDPTDETGTISGIILLSSSSASLLELICVSSLQDRAFCDLTDAVFSWGSNALTYLDAGRFHMILLRSCYESLTGRSGLIMCSYLCCGIRTRSAR